jgi:hypothetical protein
MPQGFRVEVARKRVVFPVVMLVAASVAALAFGGCAAETDAPDTSLVTNAGATLQGHGSCDSSETSLNGTYQFQYQRDGEGSTWHGTPSPPVSYTCPDSKTVTRVVSRLWPDSDYRYRGKLVIGANTYYCNTTGCSSTAGSPSNYDDTLFHTSNYLSSSSPWKTDISGVSAASRSAAWSDIVDDATTSGGTFTNGSVNVQYDQAQNNAVPVYVGKPADPDKAIDITGGGSSIESLIDNVDIPSGATPAPGGDHHVAFWNPSKNLMVSCFDAAVSGGNWTAGRCDVSTTEDSGSGASAASGFLSTHDDGSNASGSWGSTGSGLPVAAGVITLADLDKATQNNTTATAIDHAIAVGLPGGANASASLDYLSGTTGVQSLVYPAQETDGNCTTSLDACVPEGARFRFPSGTDCTTQSTRIGKVVCLTGKKYGFIDRDNNGGDLTFYTQGTTGQGSNYTDYFADGDALHAALDRDQLPWANVEFIGQSLGKWCTIQSGVSAFPCTLP